MKVHSGERRGRFEGSSLIMLSGRTVLSKATLRASPAVPADLKGALLLRCAVASNIAKTVNSVMRNQQ